jgi:hypothetical protein
MASKSWKGFLQAICWFDVNIKDLIDSNEQCMFLIA